MPNSTVNKTFAFATTVESFVATAATNVTLSYDSTTGNPAGALKSTTSTKNKAAAVNYWEWTGTWESLGIPTNSNIVSVQLTSANYRCSGFTAGTGVKSGPYELRDSTGTLLTTFWAGVSQTISSTSWSTVAASPAYTVPSGSNVSSNTIKIRLNNTIGTTNTNGATVTLYDDQITLAIIYNQDRQGISVPSVTHAVITASGVGTVPKFTANSTVSMTHSTVSASATSGVRLDKFMALYTTTGQDGIQSYGGALGDVFTVGSQAIRINRLGVFDDLGNGVVGPLHVAIFNGAGQTVTDILTFTSTDQGILFNGYRLKPLNLPVILSAGTQYSIQAWGFSDNDRNGNAGLNYVYANTDTGGGLITFNGSFYGDAGPGVPTGVNTAFIGLYMAGTFEFAESNTVSTYIGPYTLNTINKGFRDMILVKLNEGTALHRRVTFDLISTADNISAVTGASFASGDIKISKPGVSETNATGTVIEIGGGLYDYEMVSGDCDTLGRATIRIAKSGALPFKAIVQIVAFDPYDAQTYGLSGVNINLGQVVPFTDISPNTTQTVGDCLSSARADAAGKWTLSGTVLTLYGPDGTTVVRQFALNDSANPTQRA